jgi:PIN domain nuclease of toxin-antitoxin system
VILLLDTHVAVWSVSDSNRLPGHIRDLLADPVNELHVSAATLWEIAIKSALSRRSSFPFSATRAMILFREVGFELLPVEPQHAVAVEALPLLHGDPFDRLLVAQALTEPMRLVSHDRQVAAYSDTVITW